MDFYTKTEVNAIFGKSAQSDSRYDLYTKAEIETNFGTPETLALPPDMLDFYTKAEIDSIPTTPAYDETKIALIELDENDNPTSNVSYFSSFDSDFWAEMNADQSDRFWVRVGADSGITSIANQAFGTQSTGTATLRKMTIEPTVTVVGSYAFANCTNLKSIEFSFTGSTGTVGTGAFLNCTALTSIDLPVCYSIYNDAFMNCSALASVTLYDGLHSILQRAFGGCTALTSIEIPSTVTAMYNQYKYETFKGCTNLTQITVQQPSGSISGAPWGATNATVTWAN